MEYGRLQVKLERHPSRGARVLSELGQEHIQLRALLDLQALVAEFFEASRPDEAVRAASAARVRALYTATEGEPSATERRLFPMRSGRHEGRFKSFGLIWMPCLSHFVARLKTYI